MIEMMISILLIGLILMGLATSLVTSLRSIRVAEKTSLASALHQEILESELAREWDLIGIWSGDPDYAPTVTEDGETFVTAEREDDLGLTRRKQHVERGGVPFDVTLDVYWVDADGNGTTEAKRLRTTVEWADGARTSSSQFYAMRLPYAADFEEDFEILYFTASPNMVELDPSTNLTKQAVQLTVNLSTKGLQPAVTYERADGSVGAATGWTSNADGTSWSGTIPVNSGPFASGDHQLALSVTSASTPAQTREAGFTLGMTGGSITGSDFSIQQFNVSPVPAKVTNQRKLCDTTFTIRVVGFTAEDTVDVIYEYWTANSGGGDASKFEKNRSDSIQARYLRTETSESSNVAVYGITLESVASQYFVENKSVTLTALARRAGTDFSKTLERELSFTSTGTGNCP